MCLIRSDENLQALGFISYPKIEIKRDCFTFISGRSGCGKSTYLKILNRTLLPSRGSFFYMDKCIDEFPVLQYRKSVLLVPQDVYLFDGTIRDNFNIYYDMRESQHLSDQAITDFLRICCADFSPDSDCRNLSGGERQRVFLAIFISCTPDVLLLDEPTAALDGDTSIQLLSNIKTFCKNNRITAVCVCHNGELIKKFSDNTIELESQEGRHV